MTQQCSRSVPSPAASTLTPSRTTSRLSSTVHLCTPVLVSASSVSSSSSAVCTTSVKLQCSPETHKDFTPEQRK